MHAVSAVAFHENMPIVDHHRASAHHANDAVVVVVDQKIYHDKADCDVHGVAVAVGCVPADGGNPSHHVEHSACRFAKCPSSLRHSHRGYVFRCE